MGIYTPPPFGTSVKYLYCPKCKEVRAKTWYQQRDRCLACIGPATVIKVPNSALTYVNYFLYVFVPGLVAVYLWKEDRSYVWLAVGFLVIMMITSYIDLLRGERYARKKVKIASSDLNEFRRRGWT
ncbi:MAG: hypothetical protein A3K60_03360 [Euryarchaeota archaeon RBG_19FT_COMBO_56_21]|nr:MAG: hypothetical protein A3K60_03360 [Euryarchaeota archaeon RBG_19FT_COMBO_56_21]